MLYRLLPLCLFLVLGGCRIIQLPGEGGDIITPDRVFDCFEGPCEIEIDSIGDLVFTAEPEPGFEFVAWRQLCAQFDSPRCELPINEALATADIEGEQVALFAPIPQDNLATERVIIDTNIGYIVIELFGNVSPVTVNNFIQYLDDGFYDGTTFHRSIPRFVIQGGGFSYTPEDGFQERETREPILNESINRQSNLRGTVAMARLEGPDTARAQFFINLIDNPSLDYLTFSQPGFAVFGRVVAGMDVVDEIGRTRFEPIRTGRTPEFIYEIRSITRHGPPGRF